ncbi:hypothetical protein KIN20_033180 [Parelaphostrongylus tenuis]|uniref:Uncharacterized protein n=1 Tax=Parelaphostrongylus tenuis TaxID=148309 RepID=A0AAD5R819_PARTN|nr:hypothetical protein KIN20_033180 [Parelaphostrongylus tenuis]
MASRARKRTGLLHSFWEDKPIDTSIFPILTYTILMIFMLIDDQSIIDLASLVTAHSSVDHTILDSDVKSESDSHRNRPDSSCLWTKGTQQF